MFVHHHNGLINKLRVRLLFSVIEYFFMAFFHLDNFFEIILTPNTIINGIFTPKLKSLYYNILLYIKKKRWKRRNKQFVHTFY